MPMTVSCPNCSSRYALPAHLLGPSGARVVCPACWHRFSLDSEGEVVPEERAFPAALAAATRPAPAPPEAHVEPAAMNEERSHADAALDALFGPFGGPGAAPAGEPVPVEFADAAPREAMSAIPANGWPQPGAGPGDDGPGRRPGAVDVPQDPHGRRDHLLACEALAGLERVAQEVRGAMVRGRLFSEFGPRLLEAFDRYRIAGGQDADAGTFRLALRERLGIDLE